jgi:predicted CXXCH cytochrome family protein
MRYRCVLVLSLAAIFVVGFHLRGTALSADTPAYVGSEVCGGCHMDQMKAWSDSHHSWALKPATSANILGDFNNATFAQEGFTSRFFRKDGHYFVETDGADGKLASFEIKYAVGVSPLQQYLVELDRGRLQTLDIAWDVTRKRWFHLYPNESVSSGNGLHWTGPYKNWQARCAVCHQSNFHKNFDPQTRGYQSRWSELSLGCESCHGPGEAHAAWARNPSLFNQHQFPNVDVRGLVPLRGLSRQAVEENTCGPCHSRREPLGADSPLPGSRFADHYNLSPLLGGLYYADGQQHDEVYVLGSFMQSKMHERGVNCTNCHAPHSAKLVAEGNALCTQCHNEAGRADFPTLKPGLFDSPVHHHHQMGTAGAQCVNCHMPERNYMVVDARRDHFIRVPDPLLSEKTGSPDVCRSCHTGETAAWAADQIARWSPASFKPVSTYAEAFAEARTAGIGPTTLDQLAAIVRDSGNSAIVRAGALRALADQPRALEALSIKNLLEDQSDLIRTIAARLVRPLPMGQRADLLMPLLKDSAASVRIAAALELSALADSRLPLAQHDALEKALGELKASFAAKEDFPETQMAIGGLAMTMHNWPAAEEAFSEAVLMDPQLSQAWLARARIRAALGDPLEAIRILLSAREKNAADPAVAVELAGLLLQQDRAKEAIPLLQQVITAEPTRSDYRIALAAALLREGALSDAGVEIQSLLALSPHDADVLTLHGLQQLRSGDLAGARETVRDFSQRYPDAALPPELQILKTLP